MQKTVLLTKRKLRGERTRMFTEVAGVLQSVVYRKASHRTKEGGGLIQPI